MKKILAATIIFPLMTMSTFMGPANAVTSSSDGIQVLTTIFPEAPEQENKLSQSLENEKVAYTCFMQYGWWVCE